MCYSNYVVCRRILCDAIVLIFMNEDPNFWRQKKVVDEETQKINERKRKRKKKKQPAT